MAKATILAIDDNDLNLRVIAASLSAFRVVPHLHPASALERFIELEPALVILDLVMPEVDGLEICRRIRAHEKLGNTPILFLSARNDTEAICRGFAAGCNDYLTKPFVREELYARVEAQIRLRTSEVERLELQQNLFLAARQLSLATLAAGMAHEINNPLAIILGSLEKLESVMLLQPENQPLLGRMERAARRIENVVSLLRNFACTASANGEVDICEILEKTGNLFRTLANDHSAALIIRKECSAARVRGKVENIEFVLTTLISNSLDAVKDKVNGMVEVSLTECEETLALTVVDNGCGISPENQARLFTPFFTTKPPGTGLGLGLSVAHHVVHSMQGRIDVSSLEGEGCRFTVFLPKN